MRSTSIWVVGLTLLFAGHASAQVDHRFVPVTISDGAVVFIDRLSVDGAKPRFTGWVLWVFSPLRNGVHHALSKQRFDCSTQTTATIYNISYDVRGGVVSEQKIEGLATPAVPNSLGEETLHAVCAGDAADNPLNQFQNVDAAIAFATFAMNDQKKPRGK